MYMKYKLDKHYLNADQSLRVIHKYLKYFPKKFLKNCVDRNKY